ncbi:DUF4157 domain-containing protein [Haliangium ochraceum]|uniref:eCIS core domain-containing protein n=1 Tax=Haliangium ochraceum TaxID=80816 RepID=UPI001E2F36BC|nr:DUF4157 domain-containing protein [Haliangium ochraceum]
MSGSGGRLPHHELIQQSFGHAHDLSNVQAHVGGQAAAASADIGAQAYATGERIAFRDTPDLHTAAHEAAHVVQQRAGVSLSSGVGQAGDAYERHADAVADRVVRGESAAPLLEPGTGAGGSNTVQRLDVWYAANPEHEKLEVPGATKPEDAHADTPCYEIVIISGERVSRRGQPVTYQIQSMETDGESDCSTVTARWWAHLKTTRGAQDERPGPENSDSWEVSALPPGEHTICAEVLLDESLSMLEFRQVVLHDQQRYADDRDEVKPATLSTMEDFIALVERIESAYTGWGWQNITSSIRKEYYPGRGNALERKKAEFTWGDLIDAQEDISPLQSPPVAAADIAALRSTAVIATAGGAVDIGHVLTGVDSMNFPQVAGIFELRDISGPAAATWSGDIGSALVAFATDNDSTREGCYEAFARTEDMLGDYDGIAIANMDEAKIADVQADTPLSERLRKYYLEAPEQGVSRRYHNFCTASGFDISNGELDSSAGEKIRAEILAFANAYNIEGSVYDNFSSVAHLITLGMAGTPGDSEETTRNRIAANLDWFSQHFIDAVNEGLKSEK